MSIRQSGREDKGSGCFLHPARTNAMGTDGDTTHLAVYPSPHSLEVGEPDPFGFIIGVADVISY